MSRFGDTAANDGALAALETTTLPTAAKTMCASAAAAGFRLFLMPIDAWKTTKQVGVGGRRGGRGDEGVEVDEMF